ncbi:MAG: hypothetical protein LC798_12745 [Chloroflexi bacterium]|nr:hypothetical protein [Chloroflexota bacterium]
MAAPVKLDIGPQDPDELAEFGAVGAGNTAKRLLQAHAELYNPELSAVLAQPVVEHAGDAVDLDEVERVAKPNGEVKGAEVRGDPRLPKTWVVSYIYVTESGRSARGVVSHHQLPDSAAEYDARKRARLHARTITDSQTGETHEAQAYTASEANELREEIDRLRAALEDAQDPEPYEGYGEANANEIIDDLKNRDTSAPQEYVAVQEIRDYEAAHKDRETVVAAADKALAAANEGSGEGQ